MGEGGWRVRGKPIKAADKAMIVLGGGQYKGRLWRLVGYDDHILDFSLYNGVLCALERPFSFLVLHTKTPPTLPLDAAAFFSLLVYT